LQIFIFQILIPDIFLPEIFLPEICGESFLEKLPDPVMQHQLVFLLPVRLWCIPGVLGLFEEFHQPIHQPSLTADHMQTALVLVLLENPVEITLQIAHIAPLVGFPISNSQWLLNPDSTSLN
jgi:hypothetical protein